MSDKQWRRAYFGNTYHSEKEGMEKTSTDVQSFLNHYGLAPDQIKLITSATRFAFRFRCVVIVEYYSETECPWPLN